jgi:hypothetical protein
MEATTIEAAERWFLTHSSGSLVCLKQDPDNPCGVIKQEVNSYPKAVKFFEEEGCDEQDSTKVN